MSEMDTTQAAKELGISVRSVARLCRLKKLKARQIARGTWLIDADSVSAYKALTEGLKKHDPRR